MIRFSQVQFTYPGASLPALQVDGLRIPAGSFCLLSGQSGSGKSTLLRLVNGLVPHFSGGTIQGSIEINGINPIQAGPQRMSQQVGFVFQEPENQFVVDVVEDEIVFSLENAAMPRNEIGQRLDQMLTLLEIGHLRHRKVESLSGGEAQRVAIAAALVLQPPILLLDEPTSQLDPFAAQEVLTLLDRLRRNNRLTIMLAEQRLERILPHASMLVHLAPDGQSLLAGPPQEILQHSELVPPLVELAKKRGWHPLPLTVSDAAQFLTPAEVLKEHSNPIFAAATSPVVSIKNLSVTYQRQPALRDINLDIFQGERLVIMGPNGAGKSTLLRTIVRLIKPAQGTIKLNGRLLNGENERNIFRDVGFLPQDPNALLFAESVRQEMLITLRNHHQDMDTAAIECLLQRLLLNGKSDAYPRDLSTGEKQRTALGAISITNPALLILDEPTRGLDQLAKQALYQLLVNWNAEGKTIVLVTHDVEFAASLATRLVILENGQISADGDPRTLMHAMPRYRTQIAQLFPNSGWLTVADTSQD